MRRWTMMLIYSDSQVCCPEPCRPIRNTVFLRTLYLVMSFRLKGLHALIGLQFAAVVVVVMQNCHFRSITSSLVIQVNNRISTTSILTPDCSWQMSLFVRTEFGWSLCVGFPKIKLTLKWDIGRGFRFWLQWHHYMRTELDDDITVFSRAAVYINKLN